MTAISIIIPVSNCAQELAELLSDLKHQTFTDFDVIFVDNGSFDQSPQRIRSFKRLSGFPCEIIENHLNQDMYSSFNQGLDCATGRYVLFLKPGQILHSKYLEQLVNAQSQITAFSYQQRHITDSRNIMQMFMTGLISLDLISALIERDLVADLRFEPQLKKMAEKLFLYNLLLKVTELNLISDITEHTNVTKQGEKVPHYLETLAYLDQIESHIKMSMPELAPIAWIHHYQELSNVYLQIRALSFNTRQLYLEEQRHLKLLLKEIEKQKLDLSTNKRLKSWLNRTFGHHVMTINQPQIASVSE